MDSHILGEVHCACPFVCCRPKTIQRLYGNNCPTRYNYIQIILSVNRSTCFGWYLHPSSGAHVTVFTVSGNIENVTATCRERDWVGIAIPNQSRSRQVAVTFSILPDTVLLFPTSHVHVTVLLMTDAVDTVT